MITGNRIITLDHAFKLWSHSNIKPFYKKFGDYVELLKKTGYSII